MMPSRSVIPTLIRSISLMILQTIKKQSEMLFVRGKWNIKLRIDCVI